MQALIGTPEDIRRVGVLLGNDIGQMRLQFNAKTYVVEPPYRDDNMGIWDFGDPPEDAEEEMDTDLASMRIEQQQQDNPDTDPQSLPDLDEIETKHRPVNSE